MESLMLKAVFIWSKYRKKEIFWIIIIILKQYTIIQKCGVSIFFSRSLFFYKWIILFNKDVLN